MKLSKTFFYFSFAMVSVVSNAQAQPVTWQGPATGGNEPFSMAGYMYTRMVNISSDPNIPTYGTVPNSNGGYNATYNGEGSNHLTCFSVHINFPNGLWVCEISDNVLTDGPLTHKIVSLFLTYGEPNGSDRTGDGIFRTLNEPGFVERVMQYSNGVVQSIGCKYQASQNEVAWAECEVK